MFSEYNFEIFEDNDESSEYKVYGYTKTFEEAFGFICEKYSNIIKDNNWEINLNDYDYEKLSCNQSISIIKSRFFNIDCMIKKIDKNYIQNFIDIFENNQVESQYTNHGQIKISSLYVVKNKNLINIYNFENIFKKYQKLYLNMLFDYEIFDKKDGWVEKKRDPNYLNHIRILEKIKWYLENHFVSKSIDLEILDTVIKSNKDFFLKYDDLGFDSDDEANILYMGYFIRFF